MEVENVEDGTGKRKHTFLKKKPQKTNKQTKKTEKVQILCGTLLEKYSPYSFNEIFGKLCNI